MSHFEIFAVKLPLPSNRLIISVTSDTSQSFIELLSVIYPQGESYVHSHSPAALFAKHSLSAARSNSFAPSAFGGGGGGENGGGDGGIVYGGGATYGGGGDGGGGDGGSVMEAAVLEVWG